MQTKTIIHLLSGGLDSVTLLHKLHGEGHSIHALMVDYGQAHIKELEFADFHCKRLGVLSSKIKLPSLGGLTEQSWIVPNRNAILISLAVNLAVKASADTVTIGCNASDAEMFPDCSSEFLSSINATIRAAAYDIEVCAPFLDTPKWVIGGLAREMGIGSDATWTCYVGGDEPCGKCHACKSLETK